MPLLQLPPDFWSGTGGAVLGSLLSGLVAIAAAVGGAFFGARWARDHDRHRDARHAAARLNAVVHDAAITLIEYSAHRYVEKSRTAISTVTRNFLLDSPYITDMALLDQCNQILNWLREVWSPALAHVHERLPQPTYDPQTGNYVQDLTPLREVAEPGAYALSNLGAMLSVWQMEGKLIPVRDLPDFEVVTITEGAEDPRC